MPDVFFFVYVHGSCGMNRVLSYRLGYRMISGERAGEERESLVRILSNQKSTKSSHMSCTN